MHEAMAQKVAEYEAQVRGPGKFEGQQRYVAHYWQMYLDGCADN
jgi:hypothetical protein